MNKLILFVLLFVLFFLLKKKVKIISSNTKSENPSIINKVDDLPYHLRYNLKYTKNNVHVYAENVLGYNPSSDMKYPGDYLN